MQRRQAASLVAAVIAIAPAAAGPAAALDLPSGARIAGDYLESRSAEVMVGYCVANSEVGLTGREAILAFTVGAGGWDGQPLAGLSVVAVVQADDTLGDVGAEPVAARAALLVDDRATAPQRDALVAFARSTAGPLLADVVAVEAVPIAVSSEAGLRSVRAGEVAALEVRERRHEDGLCGNETLLYPPLVPLEHAHIGYTLVHEWRGAGLEGTWKSPEKSSAYSGTFAR